MSDWKNVGSKIANAAPLLGSLFGPVGTGIGTGIKLLASAFGLKPEEVSPEKIDEILTQDPQAYLTLKRIEQENRNNLLNHYLKMEEIRLSDVANARAADVSKTQVTGKRDTNLYTLAWIVVVGFFGLCVALMRWVLPAGQNEVVFMLFGSLATGFGTVLQYFFGSSKSSQDKTELLSVKK